MPENIVRVIALKSYAEFRKSIPDRFRVTKGPLKGNKVADFREVIGKQALRFKHERLSTTGSAAHRDGRWRMWLEEVAFDEETWKILKEIDDNTVSGLKEKQSNIEFYIAIYYRFHAILNDMTFADAVDNLVFEQPLRERGEPVFMQDIRPTAPFIHPPYISREYVERRLEVNPTDGIWLNPHNHHSIKLSGRRREWAHLETFMDRERNEPFLICPVIGPSGAGKTRLISEWMKQYVPSVNATDWDAGFVISRDPKPWTKQHWKITRNTLIVIDYTFAYDEVVKQIAERSRSIDNDRKIRLIVIDHVFPKDLFSDMFWQSLYKTRSIMEGSHRELFETLEIKSEGSRSELLRDVAAAVASINGEMLDRDHLTIRKAIEALDRMGERPTMGSFHSNSDGVRHPLFAALLGHAVRLKRDFSHWSRRDLIQYYFSNADRLPWKTWNGANDRKRWGLAVGALVSAATLKRGLRISQVEHMLPGEPEALVQYANRIISAERKDILKPFEPDILGESFLLQYLYELRNFRSDKDKRRSWAEFVAMLEMPGGSQEGAQAAQNFLATVSRLIRNLLNDDATSEHTHKALGVLDSFLQPEQFPADGILRQLISIARGDYPLDASKTSLL